MNHPTKRSIKVARVLHSLDFGGIEKRYELIARHSDPESLIFVACSHGGRTAKKLSNLGFRVIVLNENTRIPNLRLIWRLRTLFTEQDINVVHSSNAEGNFHAMIAAAMARVPCRIAEETGLPNHSKKAQMIFRWAYLFAHRINAVSESVKEKILEYGEAPKDKIVIIRNPSPLPQGRSTQMVPEDRERIARKRSFQLVSVCRIAKVKNLDRAAKAFAAVVEEGADIGWWIVGDGPDRSRIQELCNHLEISDRVDFIGYLDNPTEYRRAADAFFLPSLSEGFSVALNEAILDGLLPVATMVGGPRELIKDRVGGILVDPASTASIADGIRRAHLLSPEERRTMARHHFEEVRTISDAQVYLNKLGKLYESVLSRS